MVKSFSHSTRHSVSFSPHTDCFHVYTYSDVLGHANECMNFTLCFTPTTDALFTYLCTNICQLCVCQSHKQLRELELSDGKEGLWGKGHSPHVRPVLTQVGTAV